MTLSLQALLARAVAFHRSRVAVASAEGTLTFGEAGERAARLANGLLHHLPAGTRVGVLLGNRPEYIEVDIALALAGMVKTPINPRLSDQERQFILANVGAAALITEAGELSRVNDIRDGLDQLKLVLTVGKDYAEFLSSARPDWPTAPVDPAAPSMILHTSGTTGRPKGATTTFAARLASSRNMLLSEYACGPTDGMVHAAPLSHGSGSKMLPFFIRGARNIVLPRFDPPTVLSAFAELGGTSTFIVPTMLHMLLEEGLDRRNTGNLRNITYGGSPIPPATLERALAAFGPVFTQVYGSCEAPHPVTAMPRELHGPIAGSMAHLASAGREAIDTEVLIAGEDDQPVPDGQAGELLVRGPNVMSGYWNDDAATQAAFLDGWFRTGDVGRRDDNGFIYVVDRRKDMIISGGLNVYPAEVEAVLARHPLVREVAVIGVPDEKWGEVVIACVVASHPDTTEPAMLAELTEFARREMAGYKRPRAVRLLAALPHGNTGKVAKQVLRQDFAAARRGRKCP